MRATFATVLALVLVFAGCLGADEPVEAASTQQELAVVEAAAQLNATVAEEEPVRATVPLSYSGNTGTSACVFAIDLCESVQPSREDFHVFEGIVGTPVHLVATFTYPEQKPGATFYVGFCSGPTIEEVVCDDYQTGPSPYAREFDLTTYPAGTLFGLATGSLNPATEPAGAFVFVDSTFEMAGEMHVLR